MHKSIIIALRVVAATIALSVPAFAAPPAKVPDQNAITAENATAFCRIMDGTGILSAPCKIYLINKSLDIQVPMVQSEAEKMCAGYVKVIAEKGMRFSPGWRLRILPPYETLNAMAECNLPAL